MLREFFRSLFFRVPHPAPSSNEAPRATSPFASDRRIVKEFVSQWSTQKVCEVLAFCEDGKMEFRRMCQCLLGVYSSVRVHVMEDCPDYLAHSAAYAVLHRDPYYHRVETAYLRLGLRAPDRDAAQLTRDRELIRILREVLNEREIASERERANPASDRDRQGERQNMSLEYE